MTTNVTGTAPAANTSGTAQEKAENPLHITWQDSANRITNLNQATVLDYFSERSNPFYDRSCNNEIIKMQKRNPEHLKQMTGLEYELIYVQEPILFVIRKHERQSPDRVIPLTYYYIIAGIIYQAPDLNCVINSRLMTSIFNIQSAFEEAQSYSRYHPSKGYWWEFKDQSKDSDKKASKKPKQELSSFFQRQRVDNLLGEMARKFPPKVIQPKVGEKPVPVDGSDLVSIRDEPKEEPKEGATSTMSTSNTTTSTSAGMVTSMSAPFMSGSSSMGTGTMKPPMNKKRKLGK